VRTDSATEDLLRELAPQVLSVLVRRHGQFEGCEDAVQEAVLAAALKWTADGVPDNPRDERPSSDFAVALHLGP
jgi:predicted RNA polymerase sigma factor